MSQSNMEEIDLQKLLRLKRYESPGEEYFEDFLTEFQRRQRVEMAKVSVWRLAIDRMSGALAGMQVPRVAYAGAFALFLLLVGLRVSVTDFSQPDSAVGFPALASVQSGSDHTFSLAPSPSAFADVQTGFTPAVMQADDAEPPTRYILDSRPVSYGTSLRF